MLGIAMPLEHIGNVCRYLSGRNTRSYTAPHDLDARPSPATRRAAATPAARWRAHAVVPAAHPLRRPGKARRAAHRAPPGRSARWRSRSWAATVRPEVLDNYDWDEAERERAELLGVPKKLTVEIEKRDEMRAQRQQAAQQAQQQQMLAGAVGAAA